MECAFLHTAIFTHVTLFSLYMCVHLLAPIVQQGESMLRTVGASCGQGEWLCVRGRLRPVTQILRRREQRHP